MGLFDKFKKNNETGGDADVMNAFIETYKPGEKLCIFKEISFDDLYINCLYSSVAHALYVLNNPFFDYTQSWDGSNYCFHYGHSRGTITFVHDQKLFVGAARDESSTRRKLYPNFKAINIFSKATAEHRAVAQKDTLEYLYDEENGVTQPMATVGFWSCDNKIYVSDTIEDFLNNGGEYINIISNSFEDLRAYWKAQYDFSEDLHQLANYIFDCFYSIKPIYLNEIKSLDKSCIGYDECVISLKEINADLIRF